MSGLKLDDFESFYRRLAVLALRGDLCSTSYFAGHIDDAP